VQLLEAYQAIASFMTFCDLRMMATPGGIIAVEANPGVFRAGGVLYGEIVNPRGCATEAHVYPQHCSKILVSYIANREMRCLKTRNARWVSAPTSRSLVPASSLL
jgi:hypothetical protein